MSLALPTTAPSNLANSPQSQPVMAPGLSGTSSTVKDIVGSSFKPIASSVHVAKQQLNYREGAIDSPLNNAVRAEGYLQEDLAASLVTYGRDGRLDTGASSRASAAELPVQAEVPAQKQNIEDASDQEVEAKRRLDAEIEAQAEDAELVQEQEVISQLASRDREVRAHEQAHAAVGGSYAGAPTYQFERGPDGVNYAVGGEVMIDTSQAATPQETIIKAQIIHRAALAPAEPSPQDRRVAQEAVRMEAEARGELVQETAIESPATGQQVPDLQDSSQASDGDASNFRQDEPQDQGENTLFSRTDAPGSLGLAASNPMSTAYNSLPTGNKEAQGLLDTSA